MWRVIALLALLGCTTPSLQGSGSAPAPQATPPTSSPDRIVLTWMSDPATSQAVSWRTDASVARAFAEIAVAGDGPKFVESARRQTATTEPLVTDPGPVHHHSTNFTGLKPRTKYAYRVGDGTRWSEWSQFETASRGPAPFTFVYLGDAQNDIKSHWSRVVREAFQDAPRAAFILHAGDLVDHPNRDIEWGEWFDALGFIPRTTPCVAVPGNHEYWEVRDARSGVATRQLSRHWRPTFAFPENGPAGLRETVYFFDYQGARFVGLDSNKGWEAQASWLDRVLSENPQRWTIISFHHPVYSSKAGRDNRELRDAWQPIFDRHRVDLVLTGHDHAYARTSLMGHGSEENLSSGLSAQRSSAGTVYVVSVSGPKMYEADRRPFMRRIAEGTQLYQLIRVEEDAIHYEARTAAGRVYDAFTLHKREGQANRLIDRAPDVPERIRERPGEAAAPTPNPAP